jgi:hypothetical protein
MGGAGRGATRRNTSQPLLRARTGRAGEEQRELREPGAAAVPDLPSSEGGAAHGGGGCVAPGMSVRDAWRQKENLGDVLAPLPRAPAQGAQANWQQDDMHGASCGSLPKPPRPTSTKKAAEKAHATVLPKPVLPTGEALILLPKPVLPTARAGHLSPTSGVVGGRGGRGAVARIVASDVLLTPSHVPLASVGNQDSDVGGFFLTGLFVHDTPAKGEEDAEEGQQEHPSASSKLCEKMQNIVLMRNMRASGSESESEVEQGAAPDVCPMHTEMEQDDGVLQQEEASQGMEQQEPAAPASALREEHVLLAEKRAAEHDMEAKGAAEKAPAAKCVAAANQAATEAAEQMLAQLAAAAAAAAAAEAEAASRGKEEAAAAQKEKDEQAAAECKAAGEATGAPAIKATAREQSPAQAKMEAGAKEAEAKEAPGAASRKPEEDHAACAAAARHEEEETAQERAETEAASRAATEADQAQEKEEESSHEEALDRAKVQREVQESVEESARRVCCMREELTTYLQQLEGKSARRPAAAGDEELAGGLEEDALIELPANFKEVVAAAEALAMHESERPHVRRACAAPTCPTRHAMFFSSASSSTACYTPPSPPIFRWRMHLAAKASGACPVFAHVHLSVFVYAPPCVCVCMCACAHVHIRRRASSVEHQLRSIRRGRHGREFLSRAARPGICLGGGLGWHAVACGS